MSKRKRRSLSAQELSGFCSEVALMLGAGMALYDGIEALAQAYRDSGSAQVFSELSGQVIRTGTLYEALKQNPVWPAYLVEMVGIGERTGHLEEVMTGLADYYQREGRIRRAVVSAVTYPLVLGVMMVLIVLVLVLKIMPVFRRVLGSMGVAMTASGARLMNWGIAIGWVVLILALLAVAAALLILALLRTGRRARVLACLRRAIPPLREFSVRLSSSRVASVLSMMLSSGYPLEESLSMTALVLSDGEARERVNGVSRKIAQGVGFADAIGEAGLFDEMYSRMLRMGVAAGREDQVLAEIARVYQEQAEDLLGNLVSIIEPTMVAVLCVVIGAILMSVMLPMAGIISSIL